MNALDGAGHEPRPGSGLASDEEHGRVEGFRRRRDGKLAFGKAAADAFTRRGCSRAQANPQRRNVPSLPMYDRSTYSSPE
jgi:hypothetical protein